MGNTIEMLNVSPKQSSSHSNGVGIDEIVKALNKVTMQETVLMLTFVKLMDNLNQKLLQYSQWSAEASNAAAISTKWDNILNTSLGGSGAMGGLSLFFYEDPETASPLRQNLTKNAATLMQYPYHIIIASQVIAQLLQINFAINKGKLTSDSMEIKAGTEKCKGLIDFIKEHLDSTTNTVKTMSNTEKDILEKDYNSKAKKIRNKK